MVQRNKPWEPFTRRRKRWGLMSSRQSHTLHGRMQPSSQFVNLRKEPDERQLTLRAQRNYGIIHWNWSPMSIPILLLHILNLMVRYPRLSCQDKWLISHTLLNLDGTIGLNSSILSQVIQNPRKYLDDGLDQPSTLVLQ